MFYAVGSDDRVAALEDFPPMDTGAPLPSIRADDSRLAVSYVGAARGRPRVEVVFEDAIAHYFGPPNDETLQAHPLSARGLGWYGAYEVLESSWLGSARAANRIHPRRSGDAFAAFRHFIVTFHDNTFECLAKGYSVIGDQ